MEALLPGFVLIPFLAFIISVIIKRDNEHLLSIVAYGFTGFMLACAISFTVFWLLSGYAPINVKEVALFKTEGYEFFVDFLFDRVTAVYLLVGAFLTFLITVYSRYYMHREEGYKRFFNTVLFFYSGYNLTVLAGNLETLFMGWEVLGVSSFLLIAFYRFRYLPVKNAFKVFSIYRIGDIGLLIAMWLSHHLWHENITFMKLQNAELVSHHLQNHTLVGIFIALMVLVSASAKSAQFPFSAWLPRAMEGPTPSSAIFYSSLSVHIGVLLLMRTFPFWEHQWVARFTIGGVGLLTALLASGAARVQASVKAQVAYSSMAQIGVIFMEVAAGLEALALVHFAGNAFLRTYQLLVSPSVVAYLMREQFYNFTPRETQKGSGFMRRITHTIYVLGLKEWNLDTLMYRLVWKPVKDLGSYLMFVNIRGVMLFFVPLYLAGVAVYFAQPILPAMLDKTLPEVFAFLGLVMVLRAFDEHYGARLSWLLVVLNHFWIALAVSFNERFSAGHIAVYLSGVVVSGALGFYVLHKMRLTERQVNLTRFHGHAYEHPKYAFWFLVACLGLAGFPITPTFVGEDLIFSHIHETQVVLAFFTAFSLMMAGIVLVRIYTRLFLGPHVKTYHESAQRST